MEVLSGNTGCVSQTGKRFLTYMSEGNGVQEGYGNSITGAWMQMPVSWQSGPTQRAETKSMSETCKSSGIQQTQYLAKQA